MILTEQKTIEKEAVLTTHFKPGSGLRCNNGLELSSAIAYYATAKDRLFFKCTGRLNKAEVPANGLFDVP